METDPSTQVILKQLDGKVKEYSNISENCAQNAFLVLQEHLGLNDKAILKALTPFPGGVALRGETCGVVIACLMALGLVYGRDRLGDLVGYFDTLSPASKFCTRFEKEFGGTTCREILKSDFRKLHNPVDPEKMSKISATEHRAAVVGTGVKIAAEIIREKVNS
jgi:C_GCAxxG_C_C family probable redox protein